MRWHSDRRDSIVYTSRPPCADSSCNLDHFSSTAEKLPRLREEDGFHPLHWAMDTAFLDAIDDAVAASHRPEHARSLFIDANARGVIIEALLDGPLAEELALAKAQRGVSQ